MKKDISEIINQIPSQYYHNCYIVGGCLRDLLLKRTPSDVDFVITGPASSLAETLAFIIKGTVVTFDKKVKLYRVIDRNGFHIDLEEASDALEHNLKKRDFTINAMALPVNRINYGNWQWYLIDPLDGKYDLGNKIIRATGSSTIEEDPIRALRAFRLAGDLGFCIEPETINLIKTMRKKIGDCAGERIWMEMDKIFRLPDSYHTLRLIFEKTDLISDIFPELYIGKKNIAGEERHLHTLMNLEMVLTEKLPSDLEKAMDNYFSYDLKGTGSRYTVLKLACLLHSIYENKRIDEKIDSISARLGFSREEERLLIMLFRNFTYPNILFNSKRLSNKVTQKFIKKTEVDYMAVLLFSLANYLAHCRSKPEAMKFKNFIYLLIRNCNTLFNLPQLVTGDDICKLLDIKPSPIVGKILDLISEKQLEGIIKTREEAKSFIKQFGISTGLIME